MEKTILRRYMTTVYSDGSIQLEPLDGDGVTQYPEVIGVGNYLGDCAFASPPVTERMTQIMDVVEKVKFMASDDGYEPGKSLGGLLKLNKLTSRAFDGVAARKGIRAQTVADKCCRQLGMEKSEFVNRLDEYLQNPGEYESCALYEILQAKASDGFEAEYISNRFAEMA